jgi:hypothetical protein
MLNIYTSSLTVLISSILVYWIYGCSIKVHQQSIACRHAKNKRCARNQRRSELLLLLRAKSAIHLVNRMLVDRISRSTATELLQGLRQHEYTYTQVALVFSLRALKIGELIDCTTEEFFDQALTRAEELDQQTCDDTEHLLQGIPISLKDQIDQQGADSSMGIAMRNFRPATADSLLVYLLRQQNALAGFVRTATIQGMMLPDTQSETYGIARNPYDTTRTTGGSSGSSLSMLTRLLFMLMFDRR